MNIISPRGDRRSPLAFVGYTPSEQDEAKGVVFMDWAGLMLDGMIRDAGLPVPHFLTLQPTAKPQIPDQLCTQALVAGLATSMPAFIVTCDSRMERGERSISDVLANLVPTTKGNLDKYAGSLLTSPLIPWPHFVLPIQSPNYIMRDYSMKDITVSLDLGKLREEFKYWKTNNKLQPLPERTLICEPIFPELMDCLSKCAKAQMLSNDIETIRPVKHESEKAKRESHFKKYPGIPYTLSLATDPYWGVSFSLWDYEEEQLIRIFRQLDEIFRTIPQMGQNFFLFDNVFLEAMGFQFCLPLLQDLIIRHHILWPELPHSLQFQTRQYTRQPYYKDEGKHWKPSEKRSLMHYNCLDTTVSFEVWLEQEKEFAERPQLKDDTIITDWMKRHGRFKGLASHIAI